MENKKPYSDRRWTDIPECEVTGHIEFTEEQKAEYHKKALKILEEMASEAGDKR